MGSHLDAGAFGDGDRLCGAAVSTRIPDRLARPVSYLVRNGWTGKILFESRDIDVAEDFYESVSDRNVEDEIQLIALLRVSGEKK